MSWQEFIDLPEGRAYFTLDLEGAQQLRCRTDPDNPNVVWVEVPTPLVKVPGAVMEIPLTIFMFLEPTSFQAKFQGEVDAVAISNRALKPSEVQELQGILEPKRGD